MLQEAIRGNLKDEVRNSGIRFSYTRPEHPLWYRLLVRLIEKTSGQGILERLYKEWSKNPLKNENIFAGGLRVLDIKLRTDSKALKKVPSHGPVLFIANHPFGVVDGLMLGDLATRVRPDTKMMTHSLLCQAPEARDLMLPVDFGGTQAAKQTSLLTRRRALDWLQAGHAVGIFPAGGVSTAQNPLTGHARDAAWHPFLLRLLRVPNLTIVPIYFTGQNSRIFQIVSHIHYALRIAILFRETCRLRGNTLTAIVGEPVAADKLPAFEEREDLLLHLRLMTHSLGGLSEDEAKMEFNFPSHIVQR